MTRTQLALVAMLLTACGTAGPTPSAAEATAPGLPVVPAGWVTIASSAGDVALTVPPDLGSFGPNTPVGVRVQAEAGERSTPLQVWAHGPSALADQPAPGESLRAWLENGTFLPMGGDAGATEIGDASEREMLLPAGRALELAVTVQPGSRDASRVIAYAIETADGFAVLQIIGEPDDIEARANELSLIPLLVRFGD